MRNLDRDLLVDPGVLREVDGAESAAAERRDDPVLAEGLASEEQWWMPACRFRTPVRGRDELRGSIARMSAKPAQTRPRFLAAHLDPHASSVELSADEAHHLTRVLRLGAGDAVAVFDGRGTEFAARVSAVRAGRRHARIPRACGEVTSPPPRLTLMQAVLKGAAMDDVVRDATMMGAVEIRPLLTAHTAVKPRLPCGPKRSSGGGVSRSRPRSSPAARHCRRCARHSRSTPRCASTWTSARCCSSSRPPFPPAAPISCAGSCYECHAHRRAGRWLGRCGSGRLPRSRCVPLSLGPLTLRADAVAGGRDGGACVYVWDPSGS